MDTPRRFLLFFIFCMAQALVLNRIQLFNCATPMLYVYFVIMLPRNYPRWGALLWGFALGLIVDIFSNTPGVGAASMTLVGFLQPFLIELFLPRDAEENIKSSGKSLGLGHFVSLSAILTFIFCLMFFLLEAFTFSDLDFTLLRAASSALLTLLMILALEGVRN